MLEISEIIAKMANKQARSKGFPDAKFINNWNNIVGDELAQKFIPKKIASYKGKKTLFVSADVSASSDLMYCKNSIAERVNIYYGSAMVSDVKIAK